MGRLGSEEIQRLYDTAVDLGLADERPALLGGLSAQYKASLCTDPTPAAQMLADLHALNDVDCLDDGTVPLGQWLRNAASLVCARPEGALFRDALVRLEPRLDATSEAPRSARERLLDGLGGLPNDWYHRIDDFIGAYLGGPGRPSIFCGRDGDLDAVRAWLARDDGPPNLVLTAPAGRGKSALLVRLALALAARDDLAVVFVPVSLRFETHRADVFLGCLVARLAAIHGRKRPDLRGSSVEELRARLLDDLKRPLSSGRPAVLILDGLDETVGWTLTPRVLSPRGRTGYRVIVSARDRPDDATGVTWLHDLGWERLGDAEHLRLGTLTLEDVGAALGRLPRPLDALSGQIEVVSAMMRLCEGDPLTLWMLLNEVMDHTKAPGDLDIARLQQRKPGLAARFEDWWELRRKQWGESAPERERATAALLGLLAVAGRGLGRDDILELAPEHFPDSVALDDTLRPLSRLVHGTGTASGYVPAHPGFAQHWRDRLAKRERILWNERLRDHGRRVVDELMKGDRSPARVPLHVLESRASRLRDDTASVEEWMALATRRWYDAWQARDLGPSAFLEDVLSAWNAVAADDEARLLCGALAERLPEQVQCGLVIGTIGSILANVGPALLGLLIEHEIWSVEKAIAYACAAPGGDGEGRCELLAVVAPIAPIELLPRILGAARALKPGHRRGWSRLLERLVPRLSTHQVHDILATSRRDDSTSERTELLFSFAEHLEAPLRGSLLREAAEIVERAPEMQSRAIRLSNIAKRQEDPDRRATAVSAYRAALDSPRPETSFVHSVQQIASLLPEGLQEDAYRWILEIVKGSEREWRLLDLQELETELPAPWCLEARAAADAEAGATSNLRAATRHWSLRAAQAPPEERERFIDLTCDAIARIDDEDKRFRELSQQFEPWLTGRSQEPMPARLCERCLGLVEGFTRPFMRLFALRFFRRGVSDAHRRRALELAWPSVEEVLGAEAPPHCEQDILIAISSVPPTEARAAALRARAAWLRVQLLAWVALRFPPEERSDLIEGGLAAAREVRSASKRVDVMSDLFCAAPPEHAEAIFDMICDSILEIAEPWQRKTRWIALSRMLQEPWRSWAIDRAREDASADSAPENVAEDLLELSEEEEGERREHLILEALEHARCSTHPVLRRRALVKMARIEGLDRRAIVTEALEATQSIKDDETLVDGMIRFAEPLSADDLDLVANDIDDLVRPCARADRYARLLQQSVLARDALFGRALDAARSVVLDIPIAGSRSHSLASLLRVAPLDRRPQLVRATLDAVREDLTACDRPEPTTYAELGPARLGGALARQVDFHVEQAFILAAPFLSAEELDEALELAGHLESPADRVKAFTALGLRLEEARRGRLADDLLAAGVPPWFGGDERELRHQLASILAPLWPVARRLEVLEKHPPDANHGPLLVPFLPWTQLLDRIDERLARLRDPQGSHAGAIAGLFDWLPAELRGSALEHVLCRLSIESEPSHSHLLALLLPFVPEPWVDRSLDACARTGGAATVLEKAAHRLDVSRLDRALEILLKTKSWGRPHDQRLRAINAVASERLGRAEPPRERIFALIRDELRARSTTRADVLVPISALAPVILKLSGDSTAPGIVATLRRVRAWWP